MKVQINHCTVEETYSVVFNSAHMRKNEKIFPLTINEKKKEKKRGAGESF
jgi:hypothetical protein